MKLTKAQILKLAEKHCKADHCRASFYKGYREAMKAFENLRVTVSINGANIEAKPGELVIIRDK